jgi:hypothetical protein
MTGGGYPSTDGTVCSSDCWSAELLDRVLIFGTLPGITTHPHALPVQSRRMDGVTQIGPKHGTQTKLFRGLN